LGGGGGGGNSGSAKNGGSGVVIVRYAGASVGDGTGGTITAGTGSAAGKTLHTFTSTGSSAFDLSGVDMYARLGVTVTDAITGSGGLTYEGPGRLSLAGTNDYTGATTVSAGTLYVTGALSNSAVSVGANATIGGTGSLGNGLAFAGDSFLEVVDFNDPLAVTGTITFGGGFGIDNLLGIDWDSLTANTPYTVLSTGQSFSTSDIDNFGYDNRVAVGSGRQAYFTNGSLAVIVIPEPGAALLGGLGLLVLLRRRR
jgi:autotransporter-associated beta strand protein